MHTLIVFSHLRWNFVFQRPQHLLTRLARRMDVVFFEEPVFDPGPPRLEELTSPQGVLILRPHTPIKEQGFHDAQAQALRSLLQAWIASQDLMEYSVWLYTPLALPLLNGLHPCAVAYDCMDELSAFLNAPAQLLAREATLLHLANVVFTGGPSLFDAKKTRHSNVHCLPSSVDVAHFAQALNRDLEHPNLASLPHPRLGYFGVIDERIDLDLVLAVAQAHPEWSICMVGPVAKINSHDLPRAPNLYYFPQQEYAALPTFLAAWDVCLLPFALNTATRFISPTKTLEYMAAELPVVSTPITDVRRMYESGVRIAERENFINACESALAEDAHERDTRVLAQRALTTQTSWDATAARMFDLLEQARLAGLTPEALSFFESERIVAFPTKPREEISQNDCVILGGGPTGLSAAYHYGEGSLLLERETTLGGWCRSIQQEGFTFDCAGHIMFSKDPYVLELYDKLLGANIHWQNREAWVYSKGVHTRYPFQGALHGLPADVLKECLVGAIEARFGPLEGSKEVELAAPHLKNATPPAEDCCADGTACAFGDPKDAVYANSAEVSATHAPRNFEEFIYRTWGSGVAEHFAIPYNRKLWTVPLHEMETSWLGGRVPLPDLGEMIEGALQPAAKPVGPNARFGYPLRGGFQALMDGFAPHLQGEVWLDAEALSIDPARRTIALADGRSVGYRQLISTIPLPELVRALGKNAPPEVRHAARALRHVSVRCVNLGIGREHITDKHWIYYPEDTLFHRIFVQGNTSPHCNPPGGFGLTCEISYSPDKPLPEDGEALVRRCFEDCVRVGMLRADDKILVSSQVDMPYAYVVYDHARASNVALIRTWLTQYGIQLAGRYSEWEYYNSDHAFLAGRKAADLALAKTGASQGQTHEEKAAATGAHRHTSR